MLSLDVGEFIDVRYSKKSGLCGKLTKGRIVTERVSRREHSSWNAVGVRRADVGDIHVTEACRTSVEILGTLWGPGKEGRVGLAKLATLGARPRAGWELSVEDPLAGGLVVLLPN